VRAARAARSGLGPLAPFADDEALAGFTPRQRELLGAALAVFNRKGYEGSRTREIAVEAGVSEATLFKNFPTKRHLLAALMKPFVATVIKPAMLAPLNAILARSVDVPVADVIREVMLDRLALVRARMPLFRTLVLEAARQPDIMDVIRQQILPEIIGVFTTVLDRAEARGELPSVDRRLFMRSALSLLVGYIALGGLAPDVFQERNDEAAVDSILGVLFHGVAGSHGQGGAPGRARRRNK